MESCSTPSNGPDGSSCLIPPADRAVGGPPSRTSPRTPTKWVWWAWRCILVGPLSPRCTCITRGLGRSRTGSYESCSVTIGPEHSRNSSRLLPIFTTAALWTSALMGSCTWRQGKQASGHVPKISRVRRGSCFGCGPTALRVEQPSPRYSNLLVRTPEFLWLAFDPLSENIWQIENGPSCNDEINLIRPGRNHGWGLDSWCPTTNDSGSDPVRPLRVFESVIAPTGAVFCVHCGLGTKVENAFLFGSFVDGRIRVLVPTKNRKGIASQRTIYKHKAAVLTLRAAPSGTVHFSDPNGIYRLVAT
jgi:hypothetical protein